MSSKYAVQVKNIKKSFFLPNHKNDSFKRAITQAFKKKDKGGSTFSALDGVSFNINKGDFFGIVGRNGSGKSTLLKIISEIYQPTSGSVRHDGKIVAFIELGVGFKQDLTGRENVFLNGALLGFSRQEVEDMYDEIVDFAELERFMDQKLKNYSSGMKVRLAFSVAIRAKADILILDEVLAVGDAAFQKKCTDYFETLKEDGKTVILVTHSMGNVRRFCNRAVLIEGGKVIREGDASDVADEYTKLFQKDKHESAMRDSKLVDMPRDVSIEDVGVSRTDSNITFKIDMVNNTDESRDVYVAIDIYKGKGQLVGGLEKLAVSLEPRQRITEEMTIDNYLGTGEFSVNIGIRRRGGGGLDTKRGVCLFSNGSKHDPKGRIPVIFKINESDK